MDYIVCPLCGEGFDLNIIKFSNWHIIDGFLFCKSCNKKYEIKYGVPIILDETLVNLDSLNVSNRFGYQWQRFSKIKPIYEEQFLKWISPLNSSDFKNKLVLDVGCGKGRHINIVAGWNAKFVFGVDLSYISCLTAFNNTRNFNNVCIICADLNNLPFKKGFFDIVYSIGVIHHTPQPSKSFVSISEYVKGNGLMSIWVYASETNGWIVKFVNPIRSITSKLNLNVVRVIAFLISVFIYILLKILYLPFNTITFLKPFSKYLFYNNYFSYISKFPFSEIWCITFDHLIPHISHYISYNEIKNWFLDLNFEILSSNLVNGSGWSFCGKKK